MLSHGLNFCLPPTNPKREGIFAEFEVLLAQLQHHRPQTPEKHSALKAKLSDLAHAYCGTFVDAGDFLMHRECLSAIKSLRSNSNILITKPDKGSGVVILNKTDFIKKMNSILENETKFLTLGPSSEKDNTSKIECRIQRRLLQLHKDDLLPANCSVEFSFNDIMHRQIDGVAMGSPLGPALANIFVGYYESKLFQTTSKPEMYYRYMDDTFVVFSNEDECDLFLDSLNSLHPSLRFTFEKESNLALPFLDVLVEKSPSKFITSIYRKPTFTGQYLRWNSFSPRKRKTNLILALTHRALTICSPERLPSEPDKIKFILLTNGYPEHVIKSYMAMKMKQFHALPKIWTRKMPRLFTSPMARFCFYPVWKASEICCQTVLFHCGTTCCLLYQGASLRYQQRCTAWFTEKLRDLSILMPLWQLVCRPYFPKAAGQNQTTCPQIYPFLLFFPKTPTSCSSVQIFHPDYYPVSWFWFSHWTSSFTKSYLRSTLWWQQIFYSCPRPLTFSPICSWSHFHQNF